MGLRPQALPGRIATALNVCHWHTAHRPPCCGDTKARFRSGGSAAAPCFSHDDALPNNHSVPSGVLCFVKGFIKHIVKRL